MKRDVARLLRAVLRLVEDDVRELTETMVEIDEREAANNANARLFAMATRQRVIDLEEKLEQHKETYDRFAHPAHPLPTTGFSVKVP